MPDLYKELDYILGYLYEAHGLAANNQYKLTEGDWLSEISGGIDLLIEAMNGIMTTRTAIYGTCNSFRFPGYIRTIYVNFSTVVIAVVRRFFSSIMITGRPLMNMHMSTDSRVLFAEMCH